MRFLLTFFLLFSPFLAIGDTIHKSYYFTNSNDTGETTFKALPEDDLKLKLEFDIKSFQSKRDNIDILFLIDNTGSMSYLIEAVKMNIEPIYQNVSSKFTNTRFAIATVSDHKDNKTWDLISDFTSETSTLRQKVQRIGLSKGANEDFPEDYLYGLHKAKQLTWRPKATKLIVLIGDATYHDPDNGEDKESGTDDDLDTKTVIDQLKKSHIIVSTIYCNNRAKESMEFIADNTGGVSSFYTNYNDSMVHKIDELMQRIINPSLTLDEEYTTWKTYNEYPLLSLLIPSDTARDNREVSVKLSYLGEKIGTYQMNVILGQPWGLWIIGSLLLLLLLVLIIEYLYSIYRVISLMDTTGKMIHTLILTAGLIIYILLICKMWEVMNERWFPLIWSGFWW